MADLKAKFASTVVACLVAGAPFTTVPNAANAAECLTEPRQDTPKGQHWFYRIEHGTNRHCWYLRDEGGKVSHAEPSNDSPPAADVVAQKGEPNQRSLEDARAEWAIPSPPAQNNATVAQAQPAPSAAPSGEAPAAAPSATALAPSPSPNPPQGEPQGSAEGSVQASLQASAEDSTVSSRWPSRSQRASSTPTRLAAADSSDPDLGAKAASTPAVAPAPPVPVDAPAEKAKPTASLQMLFLVILCALALAGLTASVIYRFGHRRRTVRMDAHERRAAIRESFDNAPRPPWAESAIKKTAPRIEKKTAPHIEKKTASQIEKPAKQSYAARSAAQTGMAPERYEKIEEILAQLVKHTQ